LAGFEVTLYGRFWVSPEAAAAPSYASHISARGIMTGGCQYSRGQGDSAAL